MKKEREKVQPKSPDTKRRNHMPEIKEEQEQILKKAAIHCLLTFPTLWTVGGIRKETTPEGSIQWIIAVHLRYPTGHEGYVGDLLYDGKCFTQLTTMETMRGRARQIEADPALEREWNEYRSSTIPAKKV